MAKAGLIKKAAAHAGGAHRIDRSSGGRVRARIQKGWLPFAPHNGLFYYLM
jgi:hypothetical protein